MDGPLLKYIIIAVLAAVSGFFLVGFLIFSVSSLITFKKNPQKLWGGLVGLGINGLVFLLTLPQILPLLIKAIEKVLLRFR